MKKETIHFIREAVEKEEQIKESLDLLAQDLNVDGVRGLNQVVLDTMTEFEENNTKLEFREWYINQLTNTFGEEIEGLRKLQEDAGADLNTLISILKTGESNAVFDSFAKTAMVESLKKQKQM